MATLKEFSQEEDDIVFEAIQKFNKSLNQLRPVDTKMKLKELFLFCFEKFKKNLAGEAKENLSDSEKYPLKAKVTNTRKTKILQNGQQNQIPEKVINIYLSFKIEGLTKLIKSRLENVSSRLKDSKTSIKLCYPKDFNPHTPTIIIAAAAERLVPDSIIEALKNEKGEKKYEMIVLNCIKNPVVQSNTFSIDVEGKEVFFHPTVLEYINNNGMFAWPERKDIDAILCDVILSYVSL